MTGPLCANCSGMGCQLCVRERVRLPAEPTLVQLLEDLRRNVSHATEEWVALRLPLLLRAVAREYGPDRALERVLQEVRIERLAQEAKWGQQDHPWHVPKLTVQAAREELGLPTAAHARNYVEDLVRHQECSYAAILVEEVCEAVECGDDASARAELVQVAAVAVAIVEAIDRRAT